MRARAVWAAVQSCAFVIAFAAFWQEPTQSAVVPPAKAGYVFIAPNIFVNDATVKPKTTFPLIDGISGTLVNYARNPMLEQKPLTLFVFSIWNAASGRDHDFLIPRNIWRICKSRWQSGPDSNVSGDFLHKGWRFSKVLKMKSDEWIGCLNQGRPTLWIKSRFQNFLKVFFVNNEQKPSSFCPDLSFSGCLSCLGRNIGCVSGLPSSRYRRLHVSGLFGGSIEKADSEGRQNAIEKNKQPIGNIVVVVFLVSFFCAIGAARTGGKLAAWIVGAFSFGWLALIVYFGLL